MCPALAVKGLPSVVKTEIVCAGYYIRDRKLIRRIVEHLKPKEDDVFTLEEDTPGVWIIGLRRRPKGAKAKIAKSLKGKVSVTPNMKDIKRSHEKAKKPKRIRNRE